MSYKRILISTFFAISTLAATPKINNTRIVVKLKEGHTLPDSALIKSSKHFFGDLYVVYSDDISALKNQLESLDVVNKIENDYFSGREALPKAQNPHKLAKSLEAKGAGEFNDPGVSKIWAFNDAENNGMDVLKSYRNMGDKTTSQVIVAVVDTGVDYTHEDLKDVMWVNENEIPSNGIDDDGNGYIDDIHGINTLVRDDNGNATVDMKDTHSHGTHVSGTIAAKQNNGIGVAGVASNVRIMGIRTVPNSSDETDVDVAEAFLYAAQNGAKVINCSFGKSHNEGGMLVKETIDHIGKEYGVLVVAAAGNSRQNIDSNLTYPASFNSDNLLVVASTTKSGGLSWFTNYGKKNVDLASPGSGVYSTVPGNKYSNMSGTSMASPNVAGVAAHVLSHFPGLSPVELKETLMATVAERRKFKGKMVAPGLVNLDGPLQKLK